MSSIWTEASTHVEWADLPDAIVNPGPLTVPLSRFWMESVDHNPHTVALTLDHTGQKARSFAFAQTPDDPAIRAKLDRRMSTIASFDKEARYLLVMADAWVVSKESSKEFFENSDMKVSEAPGRFHAVSMLLIDLEGSKVQPIWMAYDRGDDGKFSTWLPEKSGALAPSTVDPDRPADVQGPAGDELIAAISDRQEFRRTLLLDKEEYVETYGEPEDFSAIEHLQEITGWSVILDNMMEFEPHIYVMTHKDMAPMLDEAKEMLAQVKAQIATEDQEGR